MPWQLCPLMLDTRVASRHPHGLMAGCFFTMLCSREKNDPARFVLGLLFRDDGVAGSAPPSAGGRVEGGEASTERATDSILLLASADRMLSLAVVRRSAIPQHLHHRSCLSGYFSARDRLCPTRSHQVLRC
jgi:hypothetical protein